jgi:hypothetical protein
MNLQAELGHLAAMDAALITLTVECTFLNLGREATEAIAVLERAAAQSELALAERILIGSPTTVTRSDREER